MSWAFILYHYFLSAAPKKYDLRPPTEWLQISTDVLALSHLDFFNHHSLLERRIGALLDVEYIFELGILLKNEAYSFQLGK